MRAGPGGDRQAGRGLLRRARPTSAARLVQRHSLPYRGIEVRGQVRFVTAGVGDAVQRIASRYLGLEAGAAYADRADDDLLIRLEPGDLRAWDFADELS
jgi:hypothetical protein